MRYSTHASTMSVNAQEAILSTGTTGWTSDLELAKEKQAGSEVKEAATPSEISAQFLLKGKQSFVQAC